MKMDEEFDVFSHLVSSVIGVADIESPLDCLLDQNDTVNHETSSSARLDDFIQNWQTDSTDEMVGTDFELLSGNCDDFVDGIFDSDEPSEQMEDCQSDADPARIVLKDELIAGCSQQMQLGSSISFDSILNSRCAQDILERNDHSDLDDSSDVEEDVSSTTSDSGCRSLSPVESPLDGLSLTSHSSSASHQIKVEEIKIECDDYQSANESGCQTSLNMKSNNSSSSSSPIVVSTIRNNGSQKISISGPVFNRTGQITRDSSPVVSYQSQHQQNTRSSASSSSMNLNGSGSSQNGQARTSYYNRYGHTYYASGSSLLKSTAYASSASSNGNCGRTMPVRYGSHDYGRMNCNQTGHAVILTEEERRLCEREGIRIPRNYPLSREEERSLKRIRRKIRNKLSAQDSRKRKKEYVDAMESCVRDCTTQNEQLHRQVELLQSQKQSMVGQLKQLRELLAAKMNQRPALAKPVAIEGAVAKTKPNIQLVRTSPTATPLPPQSGSSSGSGNGGPTTSNLASQPTSHNLLATVLLIGTALLLLPGCNDKDRRNGGSAAASKSGTAGHHHHSSSAEAASAGKKLMSDSEVVKAIHNRPPADKILDHRSIDQLSVKDEECNKIGVSCPTFSAMSGEKVVAKSDDVKGGNPAKANSSDHDYFASFAATASKLGGTMKRAAAGAATVETCNLKAKRFKSYKNVNIDWDHSDSDEGERIEVQLPVPVLRSSMRNSLRRR